MTSFEQSATVAEQSDALRTATVIRLRAPIFRAPRPLFDTAPFFVCGSLGRDGTAQPFACDESGALCLDATATLRQPS